MIPAEERGSHVHFDLHYHNNHRTLKTEKQHDIVVHPLCYYCKHQLRHSENAHLQVTRQSEKV